MLFRTRTLGALLACSLGASTALADFGGPQHPFQLPTSTPSLTSQAYTTQPSDLGNCLAVASGAAAATVTLLSPVTAGNGAIQCVVKTDAPTIAVTGAANNGSGLVRLTLASTQNLVTNQVYLFAGMLGVGGRGFEGNGTFAITVIDSTHVDLQGSTYNSSDPYISGGTLGGVRLTVSNGSNDMAWLTSVNDAVLFKSDGTNWVAISWDIADLFQDLTTNSISLTVPPLSKRVFYKIFSSGGGGGSGGREATGTIRTGGASGAGGAAIIDHAPVSHFGGWLASVPYYVPGRSAGGAAVTTNSTAGNAGLPGNNAGLGVAAQIQTIPVSSTNSMAGDAFDGTDFILVGSGGLVFTSPTGLTGSFTQQTSGTTNQLNAVACNASTCIAVGAGGTIIRGTSHGSSWVTDTSGTSNQLNAVLWDGTYFVAVGNSGVILYSTGNGTWTTNAYSSANNITDIGYDGAGHYVAVDSAGNAITATSPSGTFTATLITPSSSYGLLSITFGSGKWFAVAAQGLTYWTTSPTGAWNSGITVGLLTTVKFANGYFMGFAKSNPASLLYSTDASAAVWYQSLMPEGNLTTGQPDQLAFGAGVWLFAAMGSNYVSTNPSASFFAYAVTLPLSSLPSFNSIVVNGGPPGPPGGTAASAAGGGANAGTSGGGASQASSATAALTVSGSGSGICGAGGGGGSANAANTNLAPATAPPSGYGYVESGGVAGIANGASPSIGTSGLGSPVLGGGAGGGGGAYYTGIVGQAGADGGNPCGGGGGGSASDNGYNSGGGGRGGPGEIRLWWQFSDLAQPANDNDLASIPLAA